uniref:Haloacid dehalogenase-like hydrolase domain-containing protein 2 n=1 Tax=Falco tinnunculus TaxID=100819 RepID=A0A8C4URC5_FALTI
MAALRALKAVLVDLSGTLHIEDSAVPGAQKALKRQPAVRGMESRCHFTAKDSRVFLLGCLKKILSDSFLPIHVIVLPEENHGLIFPGIITDDPNAVVVGLAPEHFHYEMMNRTFWLVLDEAPLIAIHKARYFKKKDGLALGPGPFVAGLEYTTDTKATVVGKPDKTFFLEALRGTDCTPEEAVMIGDDFRDDVGGAQNAGMRGILVRTGKYQPADEEKISLAPYLTCENFPEAVEHILEHLL